MQLCEYHKQESRQKQGFLQTCLALSLTFLLILSLSSSFAKSETGETPELVIQSGHINPVSSVAFSPDGRLLASGSWDNTIKFWDVDTGQVLRTLVGHTEEVYDIAFSPDGRLLASGSADQTIKLWDVSSGRELRTFEDHDDSVNAVAFSPDGRWLASASSDRTVKIWDVAEWQVWRTLVHSNPVISIAFSPDGRTIVSGILRGKFADTITLWEMPSGRRLRSFSTNLGVTAVVFSSDGRYIATIIDRVMVKLWDVASGRELRTFASHDHHFNAVAFSPDGRLLASGSKDKTIKLWDVASGRELRTFAGHDDYVNAVAFSPDGYLLASGSSDATIKLWDVSSGRELRTLVGSWNQVRAAALSSDVQWLATVSDDSIIKLWEVASGRLLRTLAGHARRVNAVAFSPDGHLLASGSADQTIKLWEVVSGHETHTLGGHASFVNAVAFSPDGRLLASGSSDATIKLWEVAKGRELSTPLLGHDVGSGGIGSVVVLAVEFSPDGRLLASSSSDNTVKIWEVPSGRALRTLTDHTESVKAVEFSPDGRWLASGAGRGDNTIKLWETATWRMLRTLTAYPQWKASLNALTFSPDGRWVASAGDYAAQEIKLWEVASERLLRTLIGHTGSVNTLAFSPDGRLLLSSSSDGTTRIWDAASGRELAMLITMRESNDWVVVTPGGLFDGSERGTQELVSWRIGKHIYPADRFFANYYTPGLLARIFAGESPKPEVSLPTLNLPPDATITSPSSGVFRQQQMVVQVKVEDLGGGVAYVHLYQNGKLVGTHKGKPAKTSEYEFVIDLVPGENILKVTALNRQRVESNEDWVRVTYEAPKVTATFHLLTVGINEYEDPSFDLGFAKPDAEAIARFFEQQGKRLFKSVQVVPLINKQATKDNIKKELNALVDRAKPEDVVMVYMAGHGVGLGQQFYYLARGMRKEINEEAAIRKYGIPASTIGEALRGSAALKQVLILDTCQSETALPILAKATLFRSGLGAAEDKALKMLARSNGVYLVAASTKQQYAYEMEELGHGVLTYALLSGLGEKEEPKAPTSVEGVITVLSLLQYVNQVVPELTEMYHEGKKQYPVISTTGMDFPLVVH